MEKSKLKNRKIEKSQFEFPKKWRHEQTKQRHGKSTFAQRNPPTPATPLDGNTDPYRSRCDVLLNTQYSVWKLGRKRGVQPIAEYAVCHDTQYSKIERQGLCTFANFANVRTRIVEQEAGISCRGSTFSVLSTEGQSLRTRPYFAPCSRGCPRLLSTEVMTFHSLGRSSGQARTAPRFCRVRDAGSRIQYAPELFGIASAWKRRFLELNEQFPTTKMAVWNSNSRSTHGSRWDSRWEVLILFSWNSHEAYPRFIRTGEDNIKFTPFPTPPPPPKILEKAIPMRKQFRAGIARSKVSEHFFLCNST